MFSNERVLTAALAFVVTVTLFLNVTVAIYAKNNRASANDGDEAFAVWKAGERVSADAVKRYGVTNCFKAELINDRTFKRMWGKSYKKNCTVRRSELRYVKVLHYTLDGHVRLGEMVCNKAIAQDLVEIFRKLYDAKYPIERMVLVDDYGADDEASMTANNTSCFNYRLVSGTKAISYHSRGLAVDINTLYNPCITTRGGRTSVKPVAGKPYANRRKAFPYKIDTSDLCYKLFTRHGFRWGGSWRSVKDYQHFEKRIR